MPHVIKTLLARTIRSVPLLAALGMLGGVAAIGTATGWKAPSAASVFGEAAPAEEGWCRDHGAPEATCVVCRGLKVTASPPSKRVKGEAAIAEPPTLGKPRPVVQLPSPDVLAVAGVRIERVETHHLIETVEANAESGYDMTRYAQVAARAPGFVAMVRVKAGQKVKKGEILALVDSAEVGKAKAEMLQAAAALASKRAIFERIRASTEQGFRNQADQTAAEAEVREAGIRLFNARQSLRNLGLGVPEALVQGIPSEEDVQYLGVPRELLTELGPELATANLLPIAAPLDGLIVSLSAVSGETVDAARPLFVVADTSRMWITAEVSAADAAKVGLGQELAFRPDGFNGDPIAGEVSWISTEVNDKTRTVQVRAEVANPKGRLMARMFGRATITITVKDSAVAVPVSAVQPDLGTSLVFVRLNEEVFRPRVVTTGLQSDGFVEILAGLSPGESIATEGSYFLAAQANRAKLGAGCCADD
jgi:cobalt-zinc-cadmium efflux system membrane fusion protein